MVIDNTKKSEQIYSSNPPNQSNGVTGRVNIKGAVNLFRACIDVLDVTRFMCTGKDITRKMPREEV